MICRRKSGQMSLLSLLFKRTFIFCFPTYFFSGFNFLRRTVLNCELVNLMGKCIHSFTNGFALKGRLLLSLQGGPIENEGMDLNTVPKPVTVFCFVSLLSLCSRHQFLSWKVSFYSWRRRNVVFRLLLCACSTTLQIRAAGIQRNVSS